MQRLLYSAPFRREIPLILLEVALDLGQFPLQLFGQLSLARYLILRCREIRRKLLRVFLRRLEFGLDLGEVWFWKRLIQVRFWRWPIQLAPKSLDLLFQ